MTTKTKLQAGALIALGALLGYAAASGRLSAGRLAKAENPADPPPAAKAVADKPTDVAARPGCCSTGLSRDQMVALANHNEAAADKAAAEGKKPNILVIWGDDIGWYNASCYNHGVMGYQTPNIDRIAKEGGLFTDWYGQQSCTAGRAAFMTGQSPIRTGLTKVGLPGSPLGLRPEDPTIAELLKPHGYVIGQFGKNHLGDRNEFLPTVHGFDEFLGNLYHLNAEEEPENADYPKNPAFKKKFGPRGVLHSFATDVDDPTVDPEFGKVGKQKIEDTGPLTKKRMETVDEEITAATLKFIDKAHKDGKPFFCWWNATRMHIWTHLEPKAQGVTGLGVYPDGMVEHDGQVGQLLKKLDDLGIADDTIVMYSTDNGAEVMTWPDGGATPFHGEKNTNWEGGWRVPCLIRWPGVIKPGTTFNGVAAHEDMLPTLMAAVGEPDAVEKLKKGLKVGDQTYKVHIDGYNLIPYLNGEMKDSPRKDFLYWSDDGGLLALRYAQWKVTFAEQRAHGSIDVWQEPFVNLRVPKLYNLRSDPFERADESMDYAHWRVDHAFALVPAQAFVGQWLSSFKEFPPRQKAASFSIDQVMQRLQDQAGGD